MQARVLAFVLAGGKGTRLYPLTKERAKPAVPFGGRYRIVDFVLSNLVEQADPHYVAIFGADHIYRMNIREMLEFHMHKRSQASIAAIPVHKGQATEFGVIEAAPDGMVLGFHEKRADAPTMPGDPDRVYASTVSYTHL